MPKSNKLKHRWIVNLYRGETQVDVFTFENMDYETAQKCADKFFEKHTLNLTRRELVRD